MCDTTREATHYSRLRQVFQNLFSNAVKYNDKEVCKIELSFESNEKGYLFGIKDNGPGIPEQFFKKIFKIFQTLNPRDKVEATGIGLSIAHKIVQEVGHGEIWTTSELGKGATFFFTWEK